MGGSSEKEERRIIVRMIQADRQAINRMTEHKRTEFEHVLRKGIVSMLNAEDERKALSEQRSKYLGFLTARTEREREGTNTATAAAQEAADIIPSDTLKATAKLGVKMAGATRNAVLDRDEAMREEAEAKAQLRSAQMLHYITAVNYDDIAKRVASIFGYRLQFLLFRLAAGEQGYIKLANFLVASMNDYAITRFREHKGDEVKALIDAAIPPSTDALSYREWPKIDVANFKVQPKFGTRKTLALDEVASGIVMRCGDAVRKLVGARETYFSTASQKLKTYESYTILGALNHAPILTSTGEIISGLETAHRKDEAFYGMNKYPMILLGRGETTADLGVNFATKPKNQFLEDEHVEALSRLVPDFFEHDVNYKLGPEVATVELVSVSNANSRYSTERYESPWTELRNEVGEARIKQLHAAASGVLNSTREEVVAVSNEHQIKAMQAASYIFDADEARKEVLKLATQAKQAQVAAEAVDVNVCEQPEEWLEAVTASNDAALAVRELMACVIQCSSSNKAYFEAAEQAIEAAKATLHAVHRVPVEEASKRNKMMVALDETSQYVEGAFKQQHFCQENFQMVLDFLKTPRGFSAGNDFYTGEEAAQSRAIKKLRALIKDDIEISSGVMELSRVLANHDDATEAYPQQATVLDAFNVAAKEVRQALVQVDTYSDFTACIDIVKLCEFETNKNYDDICASLKVGDAWVEAEDLEGSTQLEKKASLEAAAKTAKDCVCSSLKNAKRLAAQPFDWSNFRHFLDEYADRDADFKRQITDAVEARDRSVSLLKSIKLPEDNTLNAEKKDVFLLRAAVIAERNDLHLISRKKETHQVKPKNLAQLKDKLSTFDEKARRLDDAMKRGYHHVVGLAHDDVVVKADGFAKKTRLNELLEQARNVRKAREKVEKAGINDVGVIRFAERKALLAVAEAEDVQEMIEAIEKKLGVLQEHCVAETGIGVNSSVSAPPKKQLDDLLRTFYPSTPLITNGHEANYQGGDVEVVLLRVLALCVDDESPLGLTERVVKAVISAKILEVKQIFFQGPDKLSDHWKVWLVAAMARWVVQNVQEGIAYQVDGTKQALSTIHDATREIPPEVKCVTDVAMQNIKKAYQAVYYAKHGQSQTSKRRREQGTKTWDVVSSTLAWAGRLTHAERKWSREHRVNNAIEGLDSAPSVKSPMRMFYSLVLENSKSRVEAKTQALVALNRFEKPLLECYKQLCDLDRDQLYQVSEQDKPANLTNALRLYQRLSQLFYKKHAQAEREEDDADAFKQAIKAQRVRLYFDDWKAKTYDPDAQCERLKAVRLAAEAKAKHERHVLLEQEAKAAAKEAAKEKVTTGKESDEEKKQKAAELKLEEDAANITLENMEAMLGELNEYLSDIPRNKGMLGKTTSGYGSMFASSRNKGVRGEAKASDSDEESVRSLRSDDLAAL